MIVKLHVICCYKIRFHILILKATDEDIKILPYYVNLKTL